MNEIYFLSPGYYAGTIEGEVGVAMSLTNLNGIMVPNLKDIMVFAGGCVGVVTNKVKGGDISITFGIWENLDVIPGPSPAYPFSFPSGIHENLGMGITGFEDFEGNLQGLGLSMGISFGKSASPVDIGIQLCYTHGLYRNGKCLHNPQ